ncbi:hypothetical protein BC830DRAFT_1165255 [Chytriomyces sp. MP71]|nr:hypothetical protein BC830DRAFT_1165255 [Chytriomyces sp. MP71]
MILAHQLEPALQLPVDSQSAYQLDIGYDHTPTEYEFDFMAEIDKCGLHVKKKRKRVREGSVWRVMRSDEKNPIRVEGATWNHIVHASNQLSYEEFQKHGFLPLTRAAGSCIVSDLKYLHFSLWLAVSNSRMEYKGERLVAESVEELAALHIDAFFRADNHKFSSAGHEDVDVLMLGNGRPFYFEVVNPRVLDASREEKRHETAEGLRCNQKKVLLDPRAPHRLTRGVPLAVLEAASRLRDIELKQQTPVRVQQSRSDMVRDKIVHELHVKPEDDGEEGEGGVRMYDLVRLNLTTSAGTYVKEFCHGDGGRTVPSLKELLNVDRAEVETLDVLHVHLDWPPSVES